MAKSANAGLLLASVSLLALSVSAHAQNANSSQPQATVESADGSITLDTISVIANKRDTTLVDTPASVSAVTEEEIQRRQPDNLGDILRGMPGVEIYGGPRSTVQEPSIRGLSGERVVVRLDGARANLNVGHKGRVFIDPEMLKSVEVYRGPASTMHGTGALGGVVALTTKDAYDFLDPGETVGARAKVGYSSVDHGLTTNGMVYGRPTQNSDVMLGMTRKGTGNFEAGNGEKQPNTDDDYINALFKGGIDINDASRLTMTLQRYTDDHEMPSAPDGTSLDNIVDRESEQTSLVIGYTYDDVSNDWVDAQVNAYGLRADINETRLSDGRHDERRLDTIGLDGSNTSRFDVGGGRELAVTLGGEIYQDSQEGRRDGAATPGWFPDADMLIYGAYVDSSLAVTDALDISAGVRFDAFDLSADGQDDRDDSAASPRFSASYRLTSWMQPYVSYAEAFKAPALTEMYNDGLHFATGVPFPPDNFFVPNPDLEAEKAKTWEFGTNFKADSVLQSGDAVRAKVAYFRNKVKDYINASTDIMAGTTTSSNIPEVMIKGFEAELTYDSGAVFAGLGLSRIRGENSETGENLDNIPGDKVSLSGGYRFVDQDLEVGGRANMVNHQNRVPDGQDEIDGYATFDLFASWDASDTVDGLTVNAGIDNILDHNYRTTNTTLYQPGRNFKIAASMKF
ncbi:TonB-dependent hemoglobin/transferrin/lactoferrin family receptor [Thalassospira sp. MA62]|nr:TonB-dependent hemoglobin/transferrin/lactoferrin family receptor [Thalassospira sp. MA62]